MIVEVPDIRPGIISATTYEMLDELRRFRHVVRKIYAYELDRNLILSLSQQSMAIFPVFKQEINSFLQTLN